MFILLQRRYLHIRKKHMKPLVDFFFFSLNFDIVVFEIYLFSNRNEMLIFYRKDSNNVSLVLTQCCFS